MGQGKSQHVDQFGSDSSRLSSTEALSKLKHVAYMAGTTNEEGQNLLHCAVREDDTDFVIGVLEFARQCGLSVEGMINYVDAICMNSLQYAIANDNIESMRALLQQVAGESAKTALSNRNESGNNSVQLVAMHCSDDSCFLELLFSKADNSLCSSLIVNRNVQGENALQLAASRSKHAMLFCLQNHLSHRDFSDSIDSLMSSNCQLLITLALENVDDRLLKAIVTCRQEEVREWLDQNVPFELSSRQIEIMAPSSGYYIIPTLQTKAKKHAFVCYNPTDRSNATTEALELMSAFRDSNFIVHCYVWTCYVELRNWIVEEVEKIGCEASILALFIMSHGQSGSLRGEDGCYGPISDIIDDTRRGVPIHIPLMIGIQACQADTPAARDHMSSPHSQSDVVAIPSSDIKHVILRASNCVLLMATVYGEMAYRLNFTSAFSAELQNASNSSIYDMFAATQRRMKLNPQPRYSRQRAEMRVTGDAALYLSKY